MRDPSILKRYIDKDGTLRIPSTMSKDAVSLLGSIDKKDRISILKSLGVKRIVGSTDPDVHSSIGNHPTGYGTSFFGASAGGAYDRSFAGGHVPNFANVFNPGKHTSTGGTFSQANKPTAEGLQGLLNHIGIPYKGEMSRAGLSSLFSSKENKLKLYQFLLSDPIKVKDFPELHKEISDGNHRFELAKIAGIKNIPKMAGGHVPNFSDALSKAVGREMSAGYSSSQIRVGEDSSLVSSSNPNGLGVYNSTEGSLGNGIGLANSAGIDPKTKGMAKGFVPNFADVGTSIGLGMTQFLLALPQLQGAFEKLRGGAVRTVAELNQLENAIKNNKSEQVIQTSQRKIARDQFRQSKIDLSILQGKSTGTPADLAAIDAQRIIMEEKRLARRQSIAQARQTNRQLSGLEQTYSASTTRQKGFKGLLQVGFGQTTGYAESKVGKFQSAALGIGMAAQGIGGVASEMVAGAGKADAGKAISQFSESIGTATQIMTAIPGPIGLAIGGATALYGAFSMVDKMANGFAEKLKADNEIELTGLQKVDEASNALSQAINNYENILNDSSATTEQTLKISEKYKQALSGVAATGQEGLFKKLNIAGTMKEKQAVLLEAQEERSRKKQQLTLTSSAADLAEKRSMGRDQSAGLIMSKGLAGAAAGALIGSVIPVVGTAVGAAVGSVVGGIAGITQGVMSKRNASGSIFDEKNAKEGGGTALLQALTEGAIEAGAASDEYIKQIKEKLKLDEREISLLQKNVSLSKEYAENQQKLDGIIDKSVGSLRSQQQTFQRLISSLKNSEEGLKKFQGTMVLTQMASIGSNMRLGAKAETSNARIQAQMALIPAIEGQDIRIIKEIKAGMNVLKAEGKSTFTNINADFADGVTSIMKEGLTTGKSEGGKEQATISDKAFTDSANELKNITSKINFVGKPADITNQLKSSLLKRASELEKNPINAQTVGNLRLTASNLNQGNVQALMAKSSQALQEKSIEELEKIALYSLESKNKLEELKNQKILGAFGGIGSFMQDFGRSRRQNLRQSIGESMSRIPEVAGRGSINLLKSISDMGISSLDPRARALKERAVKGRTEDILKDMGVLSRAGFGSVNIKEARGLAEKQVTKEVDTKTIEELADEQNRISLDSNKYLEEISQKIGVQVTEQQLMTDGFMQQFQNKMAKNETTDQAIAMEKAATELKNTTIQLKETNEKIQNIKSEIKVTVENIEKDTAEGTRQTEIQKALKDILDKLTTKQSADVNAPKSTTVGATPVGGIPSFPGGF